MLVTYNTIKKQIDDDAKNTTSSFKALDKYYQDRANITQA